MRLRCILWKLCFFVEVNELEVGVEIVGGIQIMGGGVGGGVDSKGEG